MHVLLCASCNPRATAFGALLWVACGSGSDHAGTSSRDAGAAPQQAVAGSMAGMHAPTDAAARSDAQAPNGQPDARTPEDKAPDAAPPTDAGAPAAASCGLCTAYATPMQSGKVSVPALDSLSGLASSRKNPGIFFAHNDHNRPVVYALDLQGKLHQTITLSGASSSDIEDIAVGPCGDAQCVYLGDIGDNAASRSEYAILRFVEPSVPAAVGEDAQSPSFERFRFNYDDGSHNAEGLMVSPAGKLYIVTKLAEGGASSIYSLPMPLSSSSVAKALKVSTLPIPSASDMAASAAAAHPCGLGFLVRVYNRVYEFKTPIGAEFEAAFNVMPTSVAMPDEKQSEAIDYMPDGRGFITSGEGASAAIFHTACQ